MLTEAEVEAVLLDQLGALGYACVNDAISGPDGSNPEREAYSDTFLTDRLRDAIARLNPQIPEDAREDALRRLIANDRPSLIEENRRLHRAMVEGVPVEYRAEVGAGLVEHEVVALFRAEAPADLPLALNSEEVMAARWVGLDDLRAEIVAQPEAFTPWLRIYLAEHAGQIFGAD